MMRGVATVSAVCRPFLIEAVPVVYQTCRTCATGHCGGGGFPRQICNYKCSCLCVVTVRSVDSSSRVEYLLCSESSEIELYFCYNTKRVSLFSPGEGGSRAQKTKSRLNTFTREGIAPRDRWGGRDRKGLYSTLKTRQACREERKSE